MENNNKYKSNPNPGQSQQRPAEPSHKNSLSDVHLVKPSEKPKAPANPSPESNKGNKKSN